MGTGHAAYCSGDSPNIPRRHRRTVTGNRVEKGRTSPAKRAEQIDCLCFAIPDTLKINAPHELPYWNPDGFLRSGILRLCHDFTCHQERSSRAAINITLLQ